MLSGVPARWSVAGGREGVREGLRLIRAEGESPAPLRRPRGSSCSPARHRGFFINYRELMPPSPRIDNEAARQQPVRRNKLAQNDASEASR